jgi:hypothetical protein
MQLTSTVKKLDLSLRVTERVQDHTGTNTERMAEPALESSFIFDRVEFIDLRRNLSHCTFDVRSCDKLGNISGKCARGVNGEGGDNIVRAPQLDKTLDYTVHMPDKNVIQHL